jgi:predicted RNA binding protein YcfA (HicA-like mRNA interferase family)
MKLPRGVSASRLIRALEHLGYGVIRQKGSHVTVPLHNPLKTGTLHGILAEVAQMRSVAVESITELL